MEAIANVNRISKVFAHTREDGRAAFVAYITCGDPTLARTKQLVHEFVDAGVDIVEFGVPFSDPMADGVANQEAANRALANGVSLGDVLRTAGECRAAGDEIPIVLFTYYNPVFAYGLEKFAVDAEANGVDGVLIVDVPPEEASECKEHLDDRDIATIFLVAPTTDAERLTGILDSTTGFVYYVSQLGVTGERDDVQTDISEHVQAVRDKTDLPIAVGFGISTPEHVSRIGKIADGVIVGSAIVRRIGSGGDSDEMVRDVTTFVRSLTEPLQRN
jgi:tryptophan synthase alpha chain